MLSQFAGGFAVATLFQEFEDVQVLQALLPAVLPVLDRAVGQQATDPIDTANGVDEEGVARSFDQGFVKFDASLVQLVGGVGFDASLQEAHFRFANMLKDRGVKLEAGFEEGGGFNDKTQAIGLHQTIRGGQHRRKNPAVTWFLVGPAFLADAAEHALELGIGQVVAILEQGFGEFRGQIAVKKIVRDSQVGLGDDARFGEAELLGQDRGRVLERLCDEVAAIWFAAQDAFFIQEL